MKKSNIISRLCKSVLVFLLVESVVCFLLLLIFEPQLILDLLSLVGTIIAAIVTGMVIFAIGYITAIVPSNTTIKKLVAKNHCLSDERALLKARQMKMQEEISRLKSEVRKLQYTVNVIQSDEFTPINQESVDHAS